MDEDPANKSAAPMPATNTKGATQKPETTPLVQDMIGARLKAYYARIAEEPIPERFTELLKQLDEQSSSNEKKA
jgi:Anti-sigma factor NepR